MFHDYYLMHKNDIVTCLRIDGMGNLLQFSEKNIEAELLPLYNRTEKYGLQKWWKNRSVPIKREGLKKLLQDNGLELPEEYLVNNLGLSLNDCYWIRPLESQLRWQDVNFFHNDFKSDYFSTKEKKAEKNNPSYTPDSSLNGNLEKTWDIIGNDRYLIKGNTTAEPNQSINEVFASKIHKMQGYDNYAEYRLVKINNKRYRYGCMTKNFCTEKKELISAWDVVHSELFNENQNLFEHFINVCVQHGINEEQLRNDLDYQIMTDFLISNEDRHLGNIGILRDSDTLEFIRMAPIFDSGNSFFFQSSPLTQRDALLKLEVNSFYPLELQMLSQVRNKSLVDISLLPDPEELVDMYMQILPHNEHRHNLVAQSYKNKTELLLEFADGTLLDSDGNLRQKYSWIDES